MSALRDLEVFAELDIELREQPWRADDLPGMWHVHQHATRHGRRVGPRRRRRLARGCAGERRVA